MFRTQHERHERYISNTGSRLKPIFSPVFDKHGVMELEEVGTENLYDSIQSHKDSVDIHMIMKRFENGDVSVLSRVQGSYGDFTEFPSTYAEALNAMISAENYFNSLPVDVRSNFGHSFQQFLASMDKPDFLKKMGINTETAGHSVDVSSTDGQGIQTGDKPSEQKGDK